MEHKQLAASSKGHAPPRCVDHPYRDYLTIPLDELPNISNTPSNFPSKLHHILSRPEFHHVSSLHYMTSQRIDRLILIVILQRSHAFTFTQLLLLFIQYTDYLLDGASLNFCFYILHCSHSDITSIDYAIFYINLSPIVTSLSNA